jgi:hypothetical protein
MPVGKFDPWYGVGAVQSIFQLRSRASMCDAPVLDIDSINQGMFMKPKALVLFAVAATLGASTPSLALVPHLMPMLPDNIAIPVAATKADLASAEKSAKAAQAAIGASRGEKTSLVKAVKAKDESEVRSLLQKHGFSARQLEGAKIVLVDNTQGAEPQKTKVTIEASCCPLTITITIHL